ncbi:MAG TPA: branched-chain amino acid ABC transporter permease [Candidatus Sulfotelmatobacter sp.]|nr:branched-chain amino acid ABC transporter permease [Candidatus Sulfotelmatobacter sp.]
MRARRSLITLAVIAVLLALAPLVAPLIGLDISIVSEVLLDAFAAMSVNLLLGYTGLPAFGNAAFFGLGAYGAALSVKYLNVGFGEAVVIGTLVALLGGLLIGPFLLRRRGIYFGLLAIAFGQVFYFVAYRFTDFTGGEDGMTVIRPPLGLVGHHVMLHAQGFYYLDLVLFVLLVLAFLALAESPFGHVLVAIRQNETRVRYLGLDSDRFIFVALLIASGMAGLGGALYAMLINFAYPLLLDWHLSGDFVLMTVLGGAGTVFGPLVGAVIYVIGKDLVSNITPAWQIIIGGVFVVCVLLFPRGILGTLEGLRRRGRVVDAIADPNADFDAHARLVGDPNG